MSRSFRHPIGVSLDMAPLFALPEKLKAAQDRAIERTTNEVKELAQDFAHVISGAMQAGTYAKTHGKSGYSEAVQAAQDKLPTVKILPEIADQNPGEGAISNVTEQSIFEEFGTILHEPHPFMSPAAIQGEGIFISALEDEVRKELGG